MIDIIQTLLLGAGVFGIYVLAMAVGNLQNALTKPSDD